MVKKDLSSSLIYAMGRDRKVESFTKAPRELSNRRTRKGRRRRVWAAWYVSESIQAWCENNLPLRHFACCGDSFLHWFTRYMLFQSLTCLDVWCLDMFHFAILLSTCSSCRTLSLSIDILARFMPDVFFCLAFLPFGCLVKRLLFSHRARRLVLSLFTYRAGPFVPHA